MDSSVFLSHYLAEERSAEASTLIRGCRSIVASRVTEVEVRRGLSFIDSPVTRVTAQAAFAHESQGFFIMEMDAVLTDLAATIAETSRMRTLDSLHIAAAILADADAFLTFDRRQGTVARQFDLTVVGVST